LPRPLPLQEEPSFCKASHETDIGHTATGTTPPRRLHGCISMHLRRGPFLFHLDLRLRTDLICNSTYQLQDAPAISRVIIGGVIFDRVRICFTRPASLSFAAGTVQSWWWCLVDNDSLAYNGRYVTFSSSMPILVITWPPGQDSRSQAFLPAITETRSLTAATFEAHAVY